VFQDHDRPQLLIEGTSGYPARDGSSAACGRPPLLSGAWWVQVPRLLGYCHVRQPIYFRGDLRGRPLGNDALEDDYSVDIIGDTSADALLPELVSATPRSPHCYRPGHGNGLRASVRVSFRP
jgi:hypothetical protein